MKDNKPYITLEELEKELNITPEQEVEIQLQMDLMDAVIEARKSNKLTQRELGRKTGIKQSAIARIEKLSTSPQLNTLIKLLYPLGYTLRVVPLENTKSFEQNK